MARLDDIRTKLDHICRSDECHDRGSRYYVYYKHDVPPLLAMVEEVGRALNDDVLVDPAILLEHLAAAYNEQYEDALGPARSGTRLW